LTAGLALSLVAVFVPTSPSVAGGYINDTGTYAPPDSGTYAYYATYGTFGPTHSSFPRQGEGFVDPVFGNTVRRL